eukprot:1160571-Pelagomonas_calceolata.AAC.2
MGPGHPPGAPVTDLRPSPPSRGAKGKRWEGRLGHDDTSFPAPGLQANELSRLRIQKPCLSVEARMRGHHSCLADFEWMIREFEQIDDDSGPCCGYNWMSTGPTGGAEQQQQQQQQQQQEQVRTRVRPFL